MRNEDDTMLLDSLRIRKRWARFYHTLLNTKSLKLDPAILTPCDHDRVNYRFETNPPWTRLRKLERTCRTTKRLGQTASRLKCCNSVTPDSFSQCFHKILVNVWIPGEVPRQWKEAIIKVLHKKKDCSCCYNDRDTSRVAHAGASTAENRRVSD